MDHIKNGGLKMHILYFARSLHKSKALRNAGQENPAYSSENEQDETKPKFETLIEESENAAQETRESKKAGTLTRSTSEQELSKNVNDISGDRNFISEFDKRRSILNMSVRSNYELSTKKPAVNVIGRLVPVDESKSAVDETPNRLRPANSSNGNVRPSAALQRSDYSMVSASDLTPGSVEVWRELPDQVKYDPAMAKFKEVYDAANPAAAAPDGSSSVQMERLSRALRPALHVGSVGNMTELTPAGKEHVTFSQDARAALKRDESPPPGADRPLTPALTQVMSYIKISSLLCCWFFFTVVFMLYNEKKDLKMQSSVAPREVKVYGFETSLPDPTLTVLVGLNGPFWTTQQQAVRNATHVDRKMFVWLESWVNVNGTRKDLQKSNEWVMAMFPEHSIDFSVGNKRTQRLVLSRTPNSSYNHERKFAVSLRTNANVTTPFTLEMTVHPLNQTTGVTCALLLLLGLYILIIFEIVNRTLAALLASCCALGVLSVVGERPSLLEVITWLDVETLLLLFSMMLLVAITAETGLFDFIAVFTFSVTKGKMWPLINLLCFFTAVLSTFLDNVTTVLLMTPVTIRLCELMELNPVPILMAMVIYSNIGGTATPVGDPPNLIIASNQEVIDAGIHFTTFTLHMLMGILFVSVQTYFQLKFIYRDVNKLRSGVPKDIQELTRQITIWKRAAGTLGAHSQDEDIVRHALDKKVRKLETRLQELTKERRVRAVPADTFQDVLSSLKDKYKIRDRTLLYKSGCAIIFVIVLFFLHSLPELRRISLGWTALLGALFLLILANREDIDHLLGRVEWSTLLFFAALFVLMEALSKLGLIQWIGSLTESLILQVDESSRLAVAIVLILWVSGVASAFVDNIPLTTMMVRVATSLGNNVQLGLPMAPLIWSLSFGACLGGNGTLIGASANVVTAGVAEQHGYRFTFMEFFKVGFPIMLGHLVVATAYLLVCHCVFEWH